MATTAPGLYTLLRTYVDGQVLGASDYVGDHQQHITNQNPQSTGSYSTDPSQMAIVTDTGDTGTPSLAGSLAGELERLRFAIKQIKETISASVMPAWFTKSYTVVVPDHTITTVKLQDGATQVQYIRASNNNATQVSIFSTVLLTQAITLTRTRVRILGVIHARCQSFGGLNGVANFTINIKRGGTIVGQAIGVAAADGTAGTNPVMYMVEIVDNPGPGTYTYTLEANNNGDNTSSTVITTDNSLKFEEIA